MRAICGAIITAGALLGLGLTAIAFGTRYGQTVGQHRDDGGQIIQMHLYQMDKPLVFILVFLTCAAIVGLGITFVGLMYHHHRRHHEMLIMHAKASDKPHIEVSPGIATAQPPR